MLPKAFLDPQTSCCTQPDARLPPALWPGSVASQSTGPRPPSLPPSHVPTLLPHAGPQEERPAPPDAGCAASANPEPRIAGIRPYKASGDGKPHQSRAWERAGVRLGFFLFVFETPTPELNIFPHRLPSSSLSIFCSLRANRCWCHGVSEQTPGAHRTQHNF